jgi:hypothetical protein
MKKWFSMRANATACSGSTASAMRCGSGRSEMVAQPAVIRLDHARALEHRDGRDEVLPLIGEQRRGAALVEPLEFMPLQREDAAQHELGHRGRMRLRVCERERTAPRPAEDLPAVDAEVAPQQLEICDQVPRGVVPQLGVGIRDVRGRSAAAALIEQHNAVPLRIEEPAVPGRGTAAGPAVQEDDGLSVGISALLPIHAVAVTDQQHPALVRLDARIQDVVQCRRTAHSFPPTFEFSLNAMR